jgi:hypothetical protein
MTTLIETPGAELFRVVVDDKDQSVTVSDSRNGYHAWRIDSLGGEFSPRETVGYGRLAGKNKSYVRDPDWQQGVMSCTLDMPGGGKVVVTVDQDMPTEKMYYVSGDYPLEVIYD